MVCNKHLLDGPLLLVILETNRLRSQHFRENDRDKP